MKQKSLSYRENIKSKNIQSSPIFLNIYNENIFYNQKLFLESLSNLIKFHEVNYFSNGLENIDLNYIIESLINLKESLENSLNNQTQKKNEFIKKVNIKYLKLIIIRMKVF
jgi:hypothetical protein